MSNGFSEVAITSGDNDVIQIGNQRPDDFIQTGVTHTVSQETYLINNENNEIRPLDFTYPTKITHTTERGSTPPSYSVTSPLIQISISPGQSTPGYFQKPMFRPKPTTTKPEDDKYVLVPTITHQKPNKTQEFESIVNIIQMLNETTTVKPIKTSIGHQSTRLTTKKPPSTSYVFSTSLPKRPTTKPTIKTTSRKPPSTSYVFSSTPPPRRTTTAKRPQSTHKTKPTRPTYVTSTGRPSKPATATKRPKPTTVVLSSAPTKKPAIVQTASVAGPSFSVTTPTRTPFPSSSYAPASTYSSPPNVIVFAPVTEPSAQVATSLPIKPVTQLTINNVVTSTNNYYSTTARPPLPTIHITPKPPGLINTNGYFVPVTSTEFGTLASEIDSSQNELVNFPPVRNPNLNISASIVPQDDDFDLTTPAFDDDSVLNKKVEKFVNKIVLSLQEPFNELKDVLYNKNKTTIRYPATSTKKPTTKKPVKVSSPKPSTRPKPGTTRPTTRPVTTKAPIRKPTTVKRPTVITTKRPVTTTTRKPKPTKKVTTTPFPEDEYGDEETAEQLDYRKRK